MIALPRDAYHYLIFTLRPLLPPLADTQEAIARRDHAAIAQVAALCPANAAQAALAAQHVAANAQAMECLRITRDPTTTPETALRCTAQAASMMRQSQGALRLLLRAQETNAKRVAEGTTAWAEYCAEQWMMEALRTDPATPAVTDLSEDPEPDPIPQRPETDSGAEPPDGHSHPVGLDPTNQDLETNSPLPEPPVESHHAGYDPMRQNHETDLHAGPPTVPENVPEKMPRPLIPSTGWDPGPSGERHGVSAPMIARPGGQSRHQGSG